MSRAAALLRARILLATVALTGAAELMLSLGTSTAAAAKPCWERVVDDWIDNGNIDGAYSADCLQAALKNVPEDVRAYSDFEERVKQARQAVLRNRFLQQAGGGNTGPTQTTSTPRQTERERIQEVEPSVDARDPDGFIEKALASGTTDASSIPMPLIILAALAGLLMAAGPAGFAHRKLAARRGSSGPPS